MVERLRVIVSSPRRSGLLVVGCAPTPIGATKRLVRVVIVILNIIVVFAPIPLSNVIPALVIALITLAYLEEDGLLVLDRFADRAGAASCQDRKASNKQIAAMADVTAKTQ